MALPHSALALYEAAFGLSGRMLDAARAKDWTSLIELEEYYAHLVTALEDAPLSDDELALYRPRIGDWIRTTLANVAETRRHTQVRLDELRSHIASASKSRKLTHAYGAG